MFWSLPLDQIRIRHYLSMLHWHTVLTGSTWIASTNATCSTSATRILNTWRNSIATEASQCSGHLQSMKPWIHTFWAHCSGTQCWLAPPSYLLPMPYAPPWPQGSSTPGKIAVRWRQLKVLVLSTGSNHS